MLSLTHACLLATHIRGRDFSPLFKFYSHSAHSTFYEILIIFFLFCRSHIPAMCFCFMAHYVHFNVSPSHNFLNCSKIEISLNFLLFYTMKMCGLKLFFFYFSLCMSHVHDFSFTAPWKRSKMLIFLGLFFF